MNLGEGRDVGPRPGELAISRGHRLAPAPSRGAGHTHLHGLEGPEPVKLKLHLHIAAGEAVVAPSHIVIARPNPQLLALPKVIQPQDTIRQLAQPSILQPGEEDRTELEESVLSRCLATPAPHPGLTRLSHHQDQDGYSESRAAESTLRCMCLL